jgi:hypothetical protein
VERKGGHGGDQARFKGGGGGIVTGEVDGSGLAQRARWRRRRGGGVRPRPAGGTGSGAAATGGRRRWPSATVEAGEGGEGLMCGVWATVPVGWVTPMSKIV